MGGLRMGHGGTLAGKIVAKVYGEIVRRGGRIIDVGCRDVLQLVPTELVNGSE